MACEPTGGGSISPKRSEENTTTATDCFPGHRQQQSNSSILPSRLLLLCRRVPPGWPAILNPAADGRNTHTHARIQAGSRTWRQKPHWDYIRSVLNASRCKKTKMTSGYQTKTLTPILPFTTHTHTHTHRFKCLYLDPNLQRRRKRSKNVGNIDRLGSWSLHAFTRPTW